MRVNKCVSSIEPDFAEIVVSFFWLTGDLPILTESFYLRILQNCNRRSWRVGDNLHQGGVETFGQLHALINAIGPARAPEAGCDPKLLKARFPSTSSASPALFMSIALFWLVLVAGHQVLSQHLAFSSLFLLSFFSFSSLFLFSFSFSLSLSLFLFSLSLHPLSSRRWSSSM